MQIEICIDISSSASGLLFLSLSHQRNERENKIIIKQARKKERERGVVVVGGGVERDISRGVKNGPRNEISRGEER